jgi:hypothetical protein
MATWYLCNNILVGLNRHFAGELIDDAIDDVVPIQAVGGRLIASGATGLAAAAAEALACKRNGGDPSQMESIMNAAVDGAQYINEVGRDTIDSSSPVNADATNVNTAATDIWQAHEFFTAPAAKTVAYHAQYPNSTINDAVGPFTRVSPPRNFISILGGGAATPVITVTGTDYAGAVLTESVTHAGAGTKVGTKAFHTITKIASDIATGGTIDIQTGDAVGMANAFGSIVCQTVANTVETPSATDAATGAVTFGSIPDGAKDYHVTYKFPAVHNHLGVAHTHTTSHTHTFS